MNKPKLPKDRLIEPEEGRHGPGEHLIDGDVEGHSLPTTAPPAFGAQRSPGHGGELTPTDDDDVEGPSI